MNEIVNFFTVHVWMAVLGGLFGGLKVFIKSRGYSTEKKFHHVLEDIVDFFISIIIAVSTTSFFFDPVTVSPFIYLGAGVFVGYVGTYALELFQLLIPQLIKEQFRQRLGVDVNVNDLPKEK